MKNQAGADRDPSVGGLAETGVVGWIEAVSKDGEPGLEPPVLVVDGVNTEKSKSEVSEVFSGVRIKRVELTHVADFAQDDARARVG